MKHQKNGNVVLYVVIDSNKFPVNKIKTEVVNAAAPHKNVEDAAPRSVLNFSIKDIVSLVNSKDLLRYLPDNMLNAEQYKTKWEGIAETIVKTNSKNDEHYVEFISKGEVKRASQMLEKSAKAAGYTIKAYHGSWQRALARVKVKSYTNDGKTEEVKRYLDKQNMSKQDKANLFSIILPNVKNNPYK